MALSPVSTNTAGQVQPDAAPSTDTFSAALEAADKSPGIHALSASTLTRPIQIAQAQPVFLRVGDAVIKVLTNGNLTTFIKVPGLPASAALAVLGDLIFPASTQTDQLQAANVAAIAAANGYAAQVWTNNSGQVQASVETQNGRVLIWGSNRFQQTVPVNQLPPPPQPFAPTATDVTPVPTITWTSPDGTANPIDLSHRPGQPRLPLTGPIQVIPLPDPIPGTDTGDGTTPSTDPLDNPTTVLLPRTPTTTAPMPTLADNAWVNTPNLPASSVPTLRRVFQLNGITDANQKAWIALVASTGLYSASESVTLVAQAATAGKPGWDNLAAIINAAFTGNLPPQTTPPSDPVPPLPPSTLIDFNEIARRNGISVDDLRRVIGGWGNTTPYTLADVEAAAKSLANQLKIFPTGGYGRPLQQIDAIAVIYGMNAEDLAQIINQAPAAQIDQLPPRVREAILNKLNDSALSNDPNRPNGASANVLSAIYIINGSPLHGAVNAADFASADTLDALGYVSFLSLRGYLDANFAPDIAGALYNNLSNPTVSNLTVDQADEFTKAVNAAQDLLGQLYNGSVPGSWQSYIPRRSSPAILDQRFSQNGITDDGAKMNIAQRIFYLNITPSEAINDFLNGIPFVNILPSRSDPDVSAITDGSWRTGHIGTLQNPLNDIQAQQLYNLFQSTNIIDPVIQYNISQNVIFNAMTPQQAVQNFIISLPGVPSDAIFANSDRQIVYRPRASVTVPFLGTVTVWGQISSTPPSPDAVKAEQAEIFSEMGAWIREQFTTPPNTVSEQASAKERLANWLSNRFPDMGFSIDQKGLSPTQVLNPLKWDWQSLFNPAQVNGGNYIEVGDMDAGVSNGSILKDDQGIYRLNTQVVDGKTVLAANFNYTLGDRKAGKMQLPTDFIVPTGTVDFSGGVTLETKRTLEAGTEINTDLLRAINIGLNDPSTYQYWKDANGTSIRFVRQINFSGNVLGVTTNIANLYKLPDGWSNLDSNLPNIYIKDGYRYISQVTGTQASYSTGLGDFTTQFSTGMIGVGAGFTLIPGLDASFKGGIQIVSRPVAGSADIPDPYTRPLPPVGGVYDIVFTGGRSQLSFNSVALGSAPGMADIRVNGRNYSVPDAVARAVNGEPLQLSDLSIIDKWISGPGKSFNTDGKLIFDIRKSILDGQPLEESIRRRLMLNVNDFIERQQQSDAGTNTLLASLDDPSIISDVSAPLIDDPLADYIDDPLMNLDGVDPDYSFLLNDGATAVQPSPSDAAQASEALQDLSTYLGWINSIVSKLDPDAGAVLGQAVSLSNAGSTLVALINNPAATSVQIDAAALAVFNAAAAFSPQIAAIAPYVNTGHQAYTVIQGLTTGSFANGAAGAGDVTSLASSISGLVHAPQALTDALTAASLVFRGISLFSQIGAGVAVGAVPIIGWVVGIASFVMGLLMANQEHWTKWQTLMKNVSVDGGQNPITGQILQNDSVDQKTSDRQRNRVAYTGQASEAPIQSATFSLVPGSAPGGGTPLTIASMALMTQYSDGSSDSIPAATLADANQVTLADGMVLTYRGTDDSGQRIFSAYDPTSDSGTPISFIDTQLSQAAPPSGPATSYTLSLDVTFASINPDVGTVTKTQTFTVTPDQAAQLQAAFGAASGTIGGNDARGASLKPFIDQMGTVRWETDHTTPNVYTYDDFNGDGLPDLMRQGILHGLFATADDKYQVTLNSSSSVATLPQTAGPITTVPGLTVLGDRISSYAMTANQAIVSANGRFMAVMQGDGNFVVYDRSTGTIHLEHGDGRQGRRRISHHAGGWQSCGLRPRRQFTLGFQNPCRRREPILQPRHARRRQSCRLRQPGQRNHLVEPERPGHHAGPQSDPYAHVYVHRRQPGGRLCGGRACRRPYAVSGKPPRTLRSLLQPAANQRHPAISPSSINGPAIMACCRNSISFLPYPDRRKGRRLRISLRTWQAGAIRSASSRRPLASRSIPR